MRPTVVQLLGWHPESVAAAGEALTSQARDAVRAEGELTLVGAGLSSRWSGEAADAATAHTSRRAREVEQLSEVLRSAGLALQRAAESLSYAQTAFRGTLEEAEAAGCRVNEDGSVDPPVLPALPPGPPGGQNSNRSVADVLESRIQSVLAGAAAADASCSSALTRLQLPTISPAPRPTTMGALGGQWTPTSGAVVAAHPASTRHSAGFWDRVGEAADGVKDHVADAAGDVVDGARRAVDGVGNLAEYAVRNPIESIQLLGDGAWLAVGAFGMTLGAVGEVGGATLNASGIGAVLGVPAMVVSASVIAGSYELAQHEAGEFSRDLTRMNAEAQDAAAGSAADVTPAANRARLSPEIRREVDEALERAATGKSRFSGHDGKAWLDWHGDLPPRDDYTEWTLAGPEAKRGANRLIIAGDEVKPDAIYYWDHNAPPVRIGP